MCSQYIFRISDYLSYLLRVILLNQVIFNARSFTSPVYLLLKNIYHSKTFQP